MESIGVLAQQSYAKERFLFQSWYCTLSIAPTVLSHQAVCLTFISRRMWQGTVRYAQLEVSREVRVGSVTSTVNGGATRQHTRHL